MNRKLRCGLLGFGGIGHCHASRYAGQPEVALVALCDIDPAKLEQEDATINLGHSGKTDLAGIRKYTSYETMIAAESLDMIDICLPTDLHAGYAVRAMRDGIHVLVEKPMGRNPAECAAMIRAAEETGKLLMVAQCLRFAWEYREIAAAYRSERYGKLRRLDLRRHGAPPGGWFRDGRRSGGAILDLHLHDVDFMNSMLGRPQTVRSFGVKGVTGCFDECVSTFTYPDGVAATVEGGWMRNGFAAGAAAVFDHATLELKDGVLSVFRVDCAPEVLAAPPDVDPYGDEIAYFAGCIVHHRVPEQALPADTMASVELIMAEIESAEHGGELRRL